MQLTWLPGAPNRAASAHRRVVGQGGLGSPATQLMRAVGPLETSEGTQHGAEQDGSRCLPYLP